MVHCPRTLATPRASTKPSTARMTAFPYQVAANSAANAWPSWWEVWYETGSQGERPSRIRPLPAKLAVVAVGTSPRNAASTHRCSASGHAGSGSQNSRGAASGSTFGVGAGIPSPTAPAPKSAVAPARSRASGMSVVLLVVVDAFQCACPGTSMIGWAAVFPGYADSAGPGLERAWLFADPSHHPPAGRSVGRGAQLSLPRSGPCTLALTSGMSLGVPRKWLASPSGIPDSGSRSGNQHPRLSVDSHALGSPRLA